MKDKKEAQQSRRRNKRLVCKLLVCMLTAAVCAICCFLISLRFENEIDPPPPRADAYFYDPDYETDILSLPEYTDGYDRTFYYYVGASGNPLYEDNCNAYGEEVALLYRMLDAILRGDAAAYNSCFTQGYLDAYGAKDRFTMQKIYNVKLENKGTPEGEGGARCFKLTYCIYKNDGTFRDDIGSDAFREQYIYVVTEGGSAKISNIAYNLGNFNQRKIWEDEMMIYVWIIAIALAVIAEALTTDLVAIWFVPAGVVSLILALCGVDIIWLQILVFLLTSILGIAVAKILFKKYAKSGIARTNIDAIIGQKCVVTQRIDNLAGCGEVRAKGLFWAARACSEDVIFEEGDVVTVVAVEGVKLICK